MRTSQTGQRSKRQGSSDKWTPSLVRCVGRFVDRQRKGGGWPRADQTDQQRPQCRPRIPKAARQLTLWQSDLLSPNNRPRTSETSSTPRLQQWNDDEGWTTWCHDQPCRRRSSGQKTSLLTTGLYRLLGWCRCARSEQRFRSSGADGKPIVEPEVGCSDRSARRIMWQPNVIDRIANTVSYDVCNRE